MSTRVVLTLFLLAITTAQSFVIPIPNASSDKQRYNNALHNLNPMQPTNNLFCRASQQSMSCYGGPAVTLQTCQSTCTCDNGRISCPSYKYCDDSTMDTFCGGLCQCASGSSSSSAMARPRINKEPELMMSPHRYPSPSVDDDDDYGDDEDDDGLKKRDMRASSIRLSPAPPGS